MPIDEERLPELKEAITSDITGCFANSLTSRLGENDLLSFGLLERDGEINNDLDPFASSEQVAILPWHYRCTHTGDFLGVAPTYIDLELRGATFVDIRNGDRQGWIFYRYVDYLGALQQIGVTTATRPSVDAAQFANWQENWDERRPERARLRDEAVAEEILADESSE